jgi:hypothetical protein
MENEDFNKSVLPIVRIDRSLDKYEKKVLFTEKLVQANEALKISGLPK